ncbi:MAG: hypothetical protein HQ583_08670 [Candidatus Abyssubacteria bacterium]|jgi:hypothetical protein|nr:hypothetical protein [Candidatus Abyssubacteria bacterium]
MPTKHNFMLKVIDARMSDVRKVLKGAGINVVSIIEIHKEEIPEQEEIEPAAETKD